MSTLSVTPPPPERGGFQERRRRAAKLTHFFGVNYNDLFGEVLASLEMGMQVEASAGALRAAEHEVRVRRVVVVCGALLMRRVPGAVGGAEPAQDAPRGDSGIGHAYMQ